MLLSRSMLTLTFVPHKEFPVESSFPFTQAFSQPAMFDRVKKV
jgi:hypothetical protein